MNAEEEKKQDAMDKYLQNRQVLAEGRAMTCNDIRQNNMKSGPTIPECDAILEVESGRRALTLPCSPLDPLLCTNTRGHPRNDAINTTPDKQAYSKRYTA